MSYGAISRDLIFVKLEFPTVNMVKKKKVFKEIRAEKFPNLMKTINTHIQEVQ